MNNVRSISPQLAVADQPTEADLGSLKKEGYAGVVNLRNDGEPEQPLSTAAEGDKVRALGMDYLHVGVGSAPLTETGVKAFCNFLDKHKDDKVLVHCRKGSRAAALVVLHRALAERWQPSEVADKARGLGLPLEGNILSLVEQYLQQNPPAK
jgi:uncharacterized protein (TIGR01244 family)